MPTPRSLSLLARGLVAAAAVCGASASHAAIYTGNWDPIFGLRFPDLGWSAQAQFEVPATCLALADGTYAGGACSGFAFLSAEVSFYRASDPTRTTVETFQVANVQTVPGAVTVANHQVGSVESDGFFDEFLPTASGAAASIDGAGVYSFNLIMLSGKEAQLYYGPPSGVTAECVAGNVDFSCGRSAVAAFGIFAPVPEPATGALLLAGLGVVAFAARRRGDRGPATRD